MKRQYTKPTVSVITLFAEDTLLTGSRNANISTGSVGADASLSNKQEWQHPIWSNMQEDDK